MSSPKIDWLKLHLDFEHAHSVGGAFEKVPEEVVRKRFVLYHEWLIRKGFVVPRDGNPVSEGYELYMDQVTLKGKPFLKKYHDKFIAKMEPRRTWEEDEKYLERSLQALSKGSPKRTG